MHSPAEDSPQRKPAYREHHSVTGANTGAPAQSKAPVGTQDTQDMLSRMSQDLAQRLGTQSSAFEVLNVRPIVWDDSSLGCPQPGNAYLPAQTPGLLVVFRYQGKPYQYHGSERGDFVYCDHPAVPGLDEK
jgi:hypothetical protein